MFLFNLSICFCISESSILLNSNSGSLILRFWEIKKSLFFKLSQDHFISWLSDCNIPLIFFEVKGKNGSGKVFLRAAPAGTGIIAGGAIRSVCEVLGIQDVVAKSLGSSNPHNVLKACVNGLKSQNSPKILSAIRGKKISEVISKREAN